MGPVVSKAPVFNVDNISRSIQDSSKYSGWNASNDLQNHLKNAISARVPPHQHRRLYDYDPPGAIFLVGTLQHLDTPALCVIVFSTMSINLTIRHKADSSILCGMRRLTLIVFCSQTGTFGAPTAAPRHTLFQMNMNIESERKIRGSESSEP